MTEAASPRSFAALVDALDVPGGLGPRLEAFTRALAAQLDAEVALVLPLIGETVLAAGSAHVAAAAAGEAAVVPVDENGARLILRPAVAVEGPWRADVARSAARLLARELAAARRDARAARTEDVMSAVTHEMNNALTPLLCHSCEPVVRESLRLRGLLETLRVVRGRTRPKELRWAQDVLERTRKLLGLSGSGTFAVEVDCPPDAARRAIGPEQDRLLTMLLTAGYALRARARAGAALRLRARVDDGRLRLELEAPVDAVRELTSDLDACDGQGAFEARLEQAPPDLVRVVLTLLRRPRVVVLEGPCGRGAAVERALAAGGLEVARAADVPAALQAATAAPEPAALLVLPGASAPALRQALHRSQPLLASRCVLLDEQLVPRGPRPAADEVDLGQLLAAVRDERVT